MYSRTVLPDRGCCPRDESFSCKTSKGRSLARYGVTALNHTASCGIVPDFQWSLDSKDLGVIQGKLL